MSFSLASSLPLELYALIDEHLSLADRKNFASTCSQVHTAFVPTLFANLRVTNRSADNDATKGVIEKYGRFVRKISFYCYFCPNEIQRVDHEGWIHSIVSGTILDKAQTIALKFVSRPDAFHYDTYWWQEAPDTQHSTAGAKEPDRSSEKIPSWQSVYNQVWSTLSINKAVLHLQIEELLPRRASVWETKQWKPFIRQLQSLSISLWSCNDTSEFKANTLSDYQASQTDLGGNFFDYAENVTRLRICADYDSPYGCDGMYNVRMALFPRQMPRLESLELENCMIDPNLVEFLVSHSKQLKHLILRDCSSGAENALISDRLSWGEFFDRIRLIEPVLERLEVTNSKVPITYFETFPKPEQLDDQGNFIPPDSESPSIRQIREDVKAGRRNLFRYTDTGNKYGWTIEDPDTNLYRYCSEVDQSEYRDLMSVVSCNARAAARNEYHP